ncbi:MAG: esterase, depolymerase family protein [Ramlibacter sp.]|jgi:poly(hydroxyalkanoate) depolymerase family esterase|nr:esterase, depolymerase family protein [Ramlibacter sp.]
MKRVKPATAWARAIGRSLESITRSNLRAGARAARFGLDTQRERSKPPPGEGDWIPGIAMSAAGARRYRLYRPPAMQSGERLPLMVMLHGCGQDAKGFAQSTRMNRVAARERFLVLYPEQDRLANAQGCWNWFDARGGRAAAEAQLIMKAIEQVCLLYAVDRARIAVAGLSAGASMAALLVTRHPDRFRALVMHSGVPPGSADSATTALAAMRGRRVAAALPTTTAAASWPPLLVIHGGRDRTVAPGNAHAAVRVWAEAAGAAAEPARSMKRGKRHPMQVTQFRAAGSAVATLVEVPELAHAWSGGAARHPYGDALGPDASRMAWSFASMQFR